MLVHQKPRPSKSKHRRPNIGHIYQHDGARAGRFWRGVALFALLLSPICHLVCLARVPRRWLLLT